MLLPSGGPKGFGLAFLIDLMCGLLSGGASGGSITNCAHLTSASTSTAVGGFNFPLVAGLKLQAGDTETIGAHACTPGTVGCGWKDGDMATYTQPDWGDIPDGSNVATVLYNNYGVVYAGTSGLFLVGLAPGVGFSMLFTDVTGLTDYLPAIGVIGPLDSNLLNPTSSSSGAFGGEVVTLKLNVDFSDAHLVHGTAPSVLGDLTLCGFSTPAINGTSVRALLASANTLLGGGSSAYSIADIYPIVASINGSFMGGLTTTFAQSHLLVGSCP